MSPFRASSGRDTPSGRFLGRIVLIEDRHSTRTDSSFLLWHAELASGADRIEVTGTSSDAWSPRSKAFAWSEAILGRRPDPGQPPDYAELYGKRVVVQVGRNDNDWPTIVELERFNGDRTGLMPFTTSADTSPSTGSNGAVDGADADRGNGYPTSASEPDPEPSMSSSFGNEPPF